MSGESHATGPEIRFFVNIGKFEIPCFDEFQTDCYIWKVRIFTKLGITDKLIYGDGLLFISKIQKLSLLHDISIKVQVKNDHQSKFSLEKKNMVFAEVTGSNPVEALSFQVSSFQLLVNWKIYCDDHSSLSSTTAVQI